LKEEAGMRTLGYALALLGAAALVLYGGYYFVVDFVLDPDVSLVVRVAVTGIVVGGVLVVASLIRERARDQKRESFREVEK
jgi:hypothetical protein